MEENNRNSKNRIWKAIKEIAVYALILIALFIFSRVAKTEVWDGASLANKIYLEQLK